MFHGVAREKGRGIPACLHQSEVKGKVAKAQARWTLKVAHLKGDATIPGLIAFSLYDTKPFYFITNACDNIKWEKKKREVWHKGLQRIVNLPFYRLNIIDTYNYGMNNVDEADQSRNSYRWDTFMRKKNGGGLS